LVSGVQTRSETKRFQPRLNRVGSALGAIPTVREQPQPGNVSGIS
jgi:hypothetical protein